MKPGRCVNVFFGFWRLQIRMSFLQQPLHLQLGMNGTSQQITGTPNRDCTSIPRISDRRLWEPANLPKLKKRYLLDGTRHSNAPTSSTSRALADGRTRAMPGRSQPP
ncbi:hypothetical protein CCHR01_11822 [Colletotrichum chrysophilum]|uniref:Uncharacterized protein n=1 Tax=Colletotrichum chrysophilum TaxID=1836956 RepID=A0AAD9ADS5_9PEZI|nr:hypothetical protein CCHR01_11822 [Colletotrichum chrysophilum]